MFKWYQETSEKNTGDLKFSVIFLPFLESCCFIDCKVFWLDLPVSGSQSSPIHLLKSCLTWRLAAILKAPAMSNREPPLPFFISFFFLPLWHKCTFSAVYYSTRPTVKGRFLSHLYVKKINNPSRALPPQWNPHRAKELQKFPINP